MSEKRKYTPAQLLLLAYKMGWINDLRMAARFNNYKFSYSILEGSKIKHNSRGFYFEAKTADGKLTRIPIKDDGRPEFYDEMMNAMTNPNSTQLAAITIDKLQYFRIAYDEDSNAVRRELENAILMDFLEQTGTVYKYQMFQLFDDAKKILEARWQPSLKLQFLH